MKRLLPVLLLAALGVSTAPNAVAKPSRGRPATPLPTKPEPKPNKPAEPAKPCPKPVKPSPGDGIFGRRLCP